MSYVLLPINNALTSLSCLQFIPDRDELLVSTFDSKLLLYNCLDSQGLLQPRLSAEIKCPSTVLSAAHTSHCTYTGCLDGTVRQFDHENMRMTSSLLNESVRLSQVNHMRSNNANLIVGTSQDGLLFYLDPRMGLLSYSSMMSAKIHAMDTASNFVTVGVAGGQVYIFDIRKRDTPWQVRSSGLRFPTACLRNIPSGEGYALSSIDGRVSMEFYDPQPKWQDMKFAFKCHRLKDKELDQDIVFPVTRLRFHPEHNTLFTAGGDGYVCVWDWVKKKRIKQFTQLREPQFISQMDLSSDGRLLAVGTEDDSFLRQSDIADSFSPKPSTIYLKRLNDSDCKSKTT